jgi:nicotinate phosphoribosyltransferase
VLGGNHSPDTIMSAKSPIERCAYLPQELFTDLYELTMAKAYHAEHMDQVAVFELAFRQMPANRNYIVVNGLTDVLNFLNDFHFGEEDIEYLRSLPIF